ncbi:DUF4340 domain-containing protein [candidate division KSB1 bacterium]|nr:DUF4340 domain-containing protein [candidate division KSB1 bacterium]
MNFKTTLILGLVLAVGVVLVLFVDKQDKEREEQKELEEKLLVIEKENINELYLQPSGIHVVRDTLMDTWKITGPVQTEADKQAIDDILNVLNRAKTERAISSDSSEYHVFGLDPARGKLVLVHNGQQDTLFIGDENPTGSFVFARKSGTPQVFLTTTTLKTHIEKNLFDLRDKRALAFEKNQVMGLDLKNPQGSFSLERDMGFWTLTSPLETRADKSTVDQILNQLSSAKAKKFVDESPASGRAYGLDSPRYLLDLYIGADNAKKTLTLGDAIDATFYAKDESRKPVFTVDSSFVHKLDVDLYELRYKKLSEVTSGQVNKLILDYVDSTIVCEKDTAGNWMITEPIIQPAKSWKISSVNSAIGRLEAKKFVSQAPKSLRPYGLAKPQLRATFYDKEDNKIAELMFGKDKGDQVYAKSENLKPVVLVDKDIVDDLYVSLDDLIDTTKVQSKTVEE